MFNNFFFKPKLIIATGDEFMYSILFVSALDVPLEASVCRLLRTKVALWEPLETWTPLDETQSAVCST